MTAGLPKRMRRKPLRCRPYPVTIAGIVDDNEELIFVQ